MSKRLNIVNNKMQVSCMALEKAAVATKYSSKEAILRRTYLFKSVYSLVRF